MWCRTSACKDKSPCRQLNVRGPGIKIRSDFSSHCHTGGLIGGFFATNLGRGTVFGIEGWRCAFYLVALVSVVVSALTLWLAVDPRKRLAVSPSLLSWPHNRSHAHQRAFFRAKPWPMK